MTGNDLHPLEEEVSREEDDSFLIKVEVSKPSNNNNNHQFVLNNLKISQKSSLASLESCNYNNHMEEADLLMYEMSKADSSMKIFDA